MTKADKLPFGEHGELTAETIRRAKLTREEKKRAYEMMEAQEAFLQIMDALSYPVDPDGHIHDVNHMHMTNIAIAWTMALCGFRKTGPVHIKKRYYRDGAGLYTDAHTWVDVRAPDDAAEELEPGHSVYDMNLPPDTRRLAAQRDGVDPPDPQPQWSVKPKIVHQQTPRPEGR